MPNRPSPAFAANPAVTAILTCLVTFAVVAIPTYVVMEYGPGLLSVTPTWLWILLIPFIAVITVRGLLTVAFLATAHR